MAPGRTSARTEYAGDQRVARASVSTDGTAGQHSETGARRILSRRDMEHSVVTALDGRFAGWPANNGAWGFDGGREVLVGFTDGPWVQTEGHNTQEPYTSHLSRSVGGSEWANETPSNFVGRCAAPTPPPGGIDFSSPGFALRAVVRDGSHFSLSYTGFPRPKLIGPLCRTGLRLPRKRRR